MTKIRSPDEFAQEMDEWLKRKKENLQEKHVEKLEREIDALTFQPEINKKSVVIMKKVQNSNIFISGG